MWFGVLLGFLLAERLLELGIARRNEQWMKARGGYEVGRSHYKWIVGVHVLFFLSLLVEVAVFGSHPASWWWLPFAVFVVAQVCRFWALFSLGPYWNTKIIVLPGAKVVQNGPYRFLRHPNYMIVATEILVIPLIFQAYGTALCFTILNMAVMGVRIPAEERALSEAINYKKHSRI